MAQCRTKIDSLNVFFALKSLTFRYAAYIKYYKLHCNPTNNGLHTMTLNSKHNRKMNFLFKLQYFDEHCHLSQHPESYKDINIPSNQNETIDVSMNGLS